MFPYILFPTVSQAFLSLPIFFHTRCSCEKSPVPLLLTYILVPTLSSEFHLFAFTYSLHATVTQNVFPSCSLISRCHGCFSHTSHTAERQEPKRKKKWIKQNARLHIRFLQRVFWSLLLALIRIHSVLFCFSRKGRDRECGGRGEERKALKEESSAVLGKR